MELTADELALWRKDPVTQEVFRYLRSKRLELMEQWAEGGLSTDLEETCRGRAQAYQDVVSITFSDIEDHYSNH